MLRTIVLGKEVEIAAIETKSVVVTANSESFLIRLISPEGSTVFLVVCSFIKSNTFLFLLYLIELHY